LSGATRRAGQPRRMTSLARATAPGSSAAGVHRVLRHRSGIFRLFAGKALLVTQSVRHHNHQLRLDLHTGPAGIYTATQLRSLQWVVSRRGCLQSAVDALDRGSVVAPPAAITTIATSIVSVISVSVTRMAMMDLPGWRSGKPVTQLVRTVRGRDARPDASVPHHVPSSAPGSGSLRAYSSASNSGSSAAASRRVHNWYGSAPPRARAGCRAAPARPSRPRHGTAAGSRCGANKHVS